MPVVSININDEKFNSKDVTVYWFGRLLTSVSKISYKNKQQIDEVFVMGNDKSVGFLKGNKTKSGSITLGFEELEGLKLAQGVNDLCDLPSSSIVITVSKPSGLVIPITLTGVLVMEDGMDSDGTSNNRLEQELPLRIGDVK